MKGEITAFEIYNELKMTRIYHKGTVIIFESDNDIRNFAKFFDDKKCEYISAFGKKNATKTMKMAEKDNVDGVLAIVDNDFFSIRNIRFDNPNILTTDSHDSETMILQSEALDNFLREFTDINKFNQYLTLHGKTIREYLLEMGKLIGFF